VDETRCDKLLQEIAMGDTTAFRDLYSEMHKNVFSYALSIVRNTQLADDISQDVFVKIRTSADKYAAGKNPVGWILTLTRNTAFDALKKQKHEMPFDVIQDDVSEYSADNIADNILLKEAMERLTKVERQIVMLYLVVGISQKEIAGLLKLPLTTVNWKYRVSIKKLAAILK
jgi:RNA polymerase sigma factor (sigma-70 family)